MFELWTNPLEYFNHPMFIGVCAGIVILIAVIREMRERSRNTR